MAQYRFETPFTGDTTASEDDCARLGAVLTDGAANFRRCSTTFEDLAHNMQRVSSALGSVRFSWVKHTARWMAENDVPFEIALTRLLGTQERFTHLRPH